MTSGDFDTLLQSYLEHPSEVILNIRDYHHLLQDLNTRHNSFYSQPREILYMSIRGSTKIRYKNDVPPGQIQTTDEYIKYCHTKKFNKKFDDFLAD